MTGSKVLNVLSLSLQIAKLLPPAAVRAPFSASRRGGVVLPAAPHLTGSFFSPQSLIKRMAQSVVEVMEDSKGKVHENLLANGGRSTTVLLSQEPFPSPWPQWKL